MNRLSKIVLVVILVVIGGGVAFLATWDIPPPSHKVEKVLDNARFSR